MIISYCVSILKFTFGLENPENVEIIEAHSIIYSLQFQILQLNFTFNKIPQMEPSI